MGWGRVRWVHEWVGGACGLQRAWSGEVTIAAADASPHILLSLVGDTVRALSMAISSRTRQPSSYLLVLEIQHDQKLMFAAALGVVLFPFWV